MRYVWNVNLVCAFEEKVFVTTVVNFRKGFRNEINGGTLDFFYYFAYTKKEIGGVDRE